MSTPGCSSWIHTDNSDESSDVQVTFYTPSWPKQALKFQLPGFMTRRCRSDTSSETSCGAARVNEVQRNLKRRADSRCCSGIPLKKGRVSAGTVVQESPKVEANDVRMEE
ncbi:unnamed protein product [Caenorhabditis sp. 36 PRJEB53466]|nr:unnamed protein product [Caenorhabditis sp. 36 PRJEB53466]